jgi:hypothetical protein
MPHPSSPQCARADAQDEIRAGYWAIFDTEALAADGHRPGPTLLGEVHVRIDAFAEQYTARFPLAVKCLLTDREQLTGYPDWDVHLARPGSSVGGPGMTDRLHCAELFVHPWWNDVRGVWPQSDGRAGKDDGSFAVTRSGVRGRDATRCSAGLQPSRVDHVEAASFSRSGSNTEPVTRRLAEGAAK